MVPEGWEEKPLAKLLEKVIDYRGKAPPKAETGTRLITARNVRMGFVSFDHAEFIDENLYLEWMNRGLPRSGDVMFTTEAPLGNVAMFPDSGTYALGQRIVTLRPRQDVSSGFLFQYLLSDEGQSNVHEKASGSTALGIKSKELLKIIVALPPLPEQQKIAEILGTWDKAIETTEALLTNARTQKRALMQSLLTGTRRFPGFEDHPWREVRLGDVCEVVSGAAFQSEGFTTDGYRLVRGSNVKRGYLDWSPSILEHWPNDIGFERYVLHEGDIVVAMDGYVGRSHAFIRSEPKTPMLLVQRVARIRASHSNPTFVYACISGKDFFVHCEKLKTATGIAHITLEDIRSFKIPLIDATEEARISQIISSCDLEIEALVASLDHLRTEKKSLMQQLLTGKLRVVV